MLTIFVLFNSLSPVFADENFATQIQNQKEEGRMSLELWVAEMSDINANIWTSVMANMDSDEGAGGGGGGFGDANQVKVSGLIPLVTNGVGSMVGSPPVESKEYFAYLGQNLGIVSPAYAQGTGWKALTPILPIWRAFRNLAYIFFVFIFIIIGFMIMFRSKIDPQTVISIQSALPKIIITLLLITFSYAIAGLLIDLIYVIIFIIVGLFNFTGLIDGANALQTVRQQLVTGNLWELTYSKKFFALGPAKAVQGIVQSLLLDTNESATIASNVIGGIMLKAAQLFFLIVLLFNIIKVFYQLMLSYVGIVVSVVFSPIILLFNALPGSDTVQKWLRGLAANILVFPAVALMFLLAAVFIGNPTHLDGDCVPGCGDNNSWCIACDVGYYSQRQSGQVWVPPFLSFIGQEGMGPNPFMTIIAFGMVTMTAKIPDVIKSVLGVEGKLGAMATQQIIGSMAKPIQTRQAYKQWRSRKRSEAFTEMQLKNARMQRMQQGG